MKRIHFFTLLMLPMLALAACDQPAAAPQQADNRRQQEVAAVEAARSVQFNANAEIDNIRRRLELTSNPNLLGYIILLNDAGQPIIYEGVRGKVTSGGKRLNPADRVERNNSGGQYTNYAFQVRAAPSDEGTHGSSAPYIFYWNADGTYRQWSGAYLYSDQPIRLRIDPLVINVTR
jgi:hypothetical protein